MLIELKKEYRISGEIWYVVYTNNAYLSSFKTEEDARKEIDLLKNHKEIPPDETILSETI